MKQHFESSNLLHINGANVQLTPFPGLRSFYTEESHLFFGREGQSDEVLDKLFRNKFISIVGASGSGKSSFMFCGVIPMLYGGFASDLGSNWHVINTRPGATPIDNLAESLLQKDSDYLHVDTNDKQMKKTIMSTLLKSSSLGLTEIIKQLNLHKNHNVLILVDQFEELFRFKRREDVNAANESLAYISLLMEAVKETDLPIYVALTMRSDFIGDCAQFPELTKYINESHYLIPQMVREQKRLAIEGPMAVVGSSISPRLVQQLLNDLGDNPDQLPIMQHALMRTWMYWIDNHEPDEVMDLRDYEAVGSMSGALSQHADEAYDELTEKQKVYCEILFKTVTEKGPDSAGVRRPTKLSAVAEVANCSEDEMIKIIDHFRIEGRSLLMPSIQVKLTSDSIIDISHESLMRIWIRLKKWVEEESESAQMYLRLSEVSANYQIGKAGLWRQPDLQLALNWKRKNQPTLLWAQRYDSAFERAMVFLQNSNEAYEEKLRLKELAQRQALRQARAIALILGVFTVLALGSLVFSIFQTLEANKQHENALAQTAIALEQTKEAQRQKDFAIMAADEAIVQHELAQQSFEEASKQRNISLRYSIEVYKQNKIASMQHELSLSAEQELKKKKHPQLIHALSASETLASKSIKVNTDNTLKGLLALQAYNFYVSNNEKSNPYELYESLYQAVKRLKGSAYQPYKKHAGIVESIVYSPDGKSIYSGGSDGKIYKWNTSGQNKVATQIYSGKEPVKTISLAANGNILAMTNASANVFLINITKADNTFLTLKGHTKNVFYTAFTPINKLVTASADSTVRIWSIASGVSEIIFKSAYGIKAVSMHPNGKFIAVSNNKGETIIVSTNNEQTPVMLDRSSGVQALQYSSDGAFIAISTTAGSIKLIDVDGRRTVALLEHPKVMINNIKFDVKDSKLACAFVDGSIRIWNLDQLSEQPTQIKTNSNSVLSIDFNKDGKELIAGCADKNIYSFSTNKEILANQICGLVNRNMTGKEWKHYIPDKDISYERTCINWPSKENE